MSTPGDALYKDYQYEFRGLVFGSGTHIITEKVSGLLSLPPVKDNDQDKLADHGAHAGQVSLGKRTIAMDVHVTGIMGEDIEEKMREVRRTFQLARKRYSKVMESFVLRRPGQVPQVIYCRLSKRDFDSNYDLARGKGSGSLEFIAVDPLIYSLNPKEVEATAAPTQTTAQVEAYNAGDFLDGTYPVIEIQGPATNPMVQNVDDDGRTMRFNVVLAAGDTLRITPKIRKVELSVALGAYADYFAAVRNDNQWWTIVPGNNLIVYTRQAGNTGANSKITVSWQDAWS